MVLKSKLNAGNIKAIDSWVLSIIRYGAGIIEWTKEPKEMDRNTGKLLTIYKCFY